MSWMMLVFSFRNVEWVTIHEYVRDPLRIVALHEIGKSRIASFGGELQSNFPPFMLLQMQLRSL
jgi:hypothetical protein